MTESSVASSVPYRGLRYEGAASTVVWIHVLVLFDWFSRTRSVLYKLVNTSCDIFLYNFNYCIAGNFAGRKILPISPPHLVGENLFPSNISAIQRYLGLADSCPVKIYGIDRTDR